MIRSGHSLHLPDGKSIGLKDGTSNPLAFLSFFELAHVGVTAEDLLSLDKSKKTRVFGSSTCERNPRSPPDCELKM